MDFEEYGMAFGYESDVIGVTTERKKMSSTETVNDSENDWSLDIISRAWGLLQLFETTKYN